MVFSLLFALVKFVHCVMCVGLVFVVLLQAGKSGGMAGIFSGGGGSDQIFSAPSGMAFIKKVTIVMGCIFLITALTLTKLATILNNTSIIG
ncbi:MAG: preprotein translocase subunit SecG [Endomicrobium sp.]|jgi:preprotein translocase subunit SecG|nr:preprotein translocase subunit SecG [Endomicrobium sp.]